MQARDAILRIFQVIVLKLKHIARVVIPALMNKTSYAPLQCSRLFHTQCVESYKCTLLACSLVYTASKESVRKSRRNRLSPLSWCALLPYARLHVSS